jgi:hypothetical protein
VEDLAGPEIRHSVKVHFLGKETNVPEVVEEYILFLFLE